MHTKNRQYTRKQIVEAINYWERQLSLLCEMSPYDANKKAASVLKRSPKVDSSTLSYDVKNSATSLSFSRRAGTVVADNAFADCSDLEEVNVLGKADIGAGAFESCFSLSRVNIYCSRANVSIGEDAFWNIDDDAKLVFHNMSLEEVKSMPNYPFGMPESSIFAGKTAIPSDWQQTWRRIKDDVQDLLPEDAEDVDLKMHSRLHLEIEIHHTGYGSDIYSRSSRTYSKYDDVKHYIPNIDEILSMLRKSGI